jgi:hypothetical protein
VLSCQSEWAKWIQGYPLSSGSTFKFDLIGGDHVTYYWYNAPEQPDSGTVTVVKVRLSDGDVQRCGRLRDLRGAAPRSTSLSRPQAVGRRWRRAPPTATA